MDLDDKAEGQASSHAEAAPPLDAQRPNHPAAPPQRIAIRQPHPVSSRFQALVLAEYGIPVQHIKNHLNMSVNTIQRLRKTARDRGFDPAVSPHLKLEYVEDAPRSGRPSKLTPEMEEAIVAAFTGEGREADEKVKTARVAEEMGLSATTVLRVLTSKGFGWERKKGNPYDGSWKIMPKKRASNKERAKKTDTIPKPSATNPIDPIDPIDPTLDTPIAPDTSHAPNTSIAPDLDLMAMNVMPRSPEDASNAAYFTWNSRPPPRLEI